MVIFRQSICFAIFVFFRFSTAKKTTSMPCPVFQFYDHGTEKCESCCDICCSADFFNMVDKCKDLCPDYYAEKFHNKRQEAPVVVDVDNNPQDGEHKANSSNFPVAAVIIVSAIVLLLSVIAGLIIAKRKAIVSILKDRPTSVEDPPENVPLQPFSRDRVVEEQETEDEQALISTTTTVGVQESEKPSDGENSWRLLPPTTVAMQSAAHSPRGGESTSPMQESTEGRLGTDKLVTGVGVVTDSTEPKTLLDSLPQSQL